jgi:hypothetical protein
VRYLRCSSTSRRQETSPHSYPALATASSRAEPSIRRASPPASRQEGEKRPCGGGSVGVELAPLGTVAARPTATEDPSQLPPVRRRRVAIGKRLRRPPTSSKAAGKRREAPRRCRLRLRFGPPSQIREERGTNYTNPFLFSTYSLLYCIVRIRWYGLGFVGCLGFTILSIVNNVLQFHASMAYCCVRMLKFRPDLRDPFRVWGGCSSPMIRFCPDSNYSTLILYATMIT